MEHTIALWGILGCTMRIPLYDTRIVDLGIVHHQKAVTGVIFAASILNQLEPPTGIAVDNAPTPVRISPRYTPAAPIVVFRDVRNVLKNLSRREIAVREGNHGEDFMSSLEHL